MPDIPCRLAQTELVLKQQQNEFDDLRNELREIKDCVFRMEMQREKQMGFLGGASLVIGGIASIGAFVINKYF